METAIAALPRKCPKCGYERQSSDSSKPDYECPSCGVIYDKALPRQSNLLKPPATVLRKEDLLRDSALPNSLRPSTASGMVSSQTARLFYLIAIFSVFAALLLAYMSHRNLKQTGLSDFAEEGAIFWLTLGFMEALFLVAIGKGLTYLKNIELSVRAVASRQD